MNRLLKLIVFGLLGCTASLLVGCGGFHSGSGASGNSGQNTNPPSGGGTCKTQLTLSWTAPTTNTDGSRLTNLAGFNIYWGVKTNGAVNLSNKINIPNPATSSYVFKSVPPNTYYFVATAYNTNGAESAPSNQVNGTIQTCMALYLNLSTGAKYTTYTAGLHK